MSSRDYLTTYIDRLGGTGAASARLGIPYPTLAAIRNGTRGVSPRMAERMAAADPLLDPNRLVWIRPMRRAGGEGANG